MFNLSNRFKIRVKNLSINLAISLSISLLFLPPQNLWIFEMYKYRLTFCIKLSHGNVMYRYVYTMDYPDWVQYHGSLSAVANQVWQTVAICWLMPEQQSWENWINPRLTKTLDTIKNHFCDWNFDGWRVSKQYCSNMSINMSVVMWPPYAMVHCL